MKILPMRSTDPDTSRHETTSEELRVRQQLVWNVLNKIGPSTDERLVAQYMTSDAEMQSPSGIRTRRDELVKKGRVEFTGEKIRGGTGRPMKVWRAI